MFRTIRVVASTALLLLSASCITPEQHRELLSANEKLRQEMQELERVNRDYQDEVRRLEGEVGRLAPLAKDAAYLKAEKAKVASILARYGKGGSHELPPGVSPVSSREGLILRVEGQVLFASGSTKLSPAGQKTLTNLVRTLQEHPSGLRIIGHTDTDTIKNSPWKTNMRLSVERALVVREFLVSAGVPEAKMSVAGSGEFQPVDPQDKAKNRRTEIVLLN